ncbi:MAG TPA: TonB-dependent receptor [Terriglobales bacterium]|nr:TonB-dependent receptor [Terriglobales bacterium]
MRIKSAVFASLALCAPFLLGQAAPPASPQPPASPAGAASIATAPYGEISGTVKAGATPLPGVSISATNTLTGQKLISSTDLAGNFTLQVPSKGRYVVRAELAAFAPATKEALINDAARSATVDVVMELASRAQEAQQQQQSQLQQLAGAMRGGSGFQNLALSGADGASAMMDGDPGPASGPGGGATGNGAIPGMNEALAAGMPPLALNADPATESFSVSGNMGRSQDMGANFEELRDRIAQEIQDRMRRGEFGPGMQGANIKFGDPGGFGGGGGGAPQIVIMGGPGGGGFNIGGRGGRFNVNQPHGMLYYSMGNSVFDARPYSLTGVPAPQADYSQNRYGAFLGGPLNIPHIYHGGTSTFFTIGFNGTRASNPFDAFATVPTPAERAGNFSNTFVNGQPVTIINPATGQPFPGSQITNINPAAAGLLNFIPLPNQPGSAQNFHYVNSADTNVDAFNFRIVKNFGAPANQQRGQGQRAGGGGQRGGRGGGRGLFNRPRNNINFGINFNQVHTQALNVFPSVVGSTKVRGLNVPFGWSHTFGRFNSNFRVNFNRNRVQTTNLYAGVNNVAGSLGINGVATDPFDWGIPGLTFTHYTGLRDITPALRRDQTLSFSETVGWVKGKHNWRFGGDFRRIQLNPRTDSNARGSFIFSGFATGYDLADFLLGLPQQTSEQFGATGYYFRGNSWDLFAQDDWRMRGNLTLNLGLRYEYVSPFSEKFDRIVNLDAAPGFTAVAPVTPNAIGPFTGKFPASLMNPDRNNFAPRVGIAWRPNQKTVVRSGYGISYNTGAYNSIVQQMAYQPPFAATATNIASTAGALTLQNGFPTAAAGTLTNNFGADRNYALGYVQNWDLNVQRELTRTIILNIGYSGAKGTRLDVLQAPNRGPNGLLLPGVQAFNWQTADGASILHSGDLRIRKRMAHGFSIGGTYTYSKSIDNASTIGGGAVVVAQNARDLAAERGLSSFDVRHRLVADYLYELPFGTNKRWLSRGGALSHVFGDWQWSGSLSAQSGSPFTARVLGAFADIARGTNGTLRANATGQPVQISDPSIEQWFNTAAFVAPPPGQFGNAGRNTIIGPGMLNFDMSVSKNFVVRDTQGLEVRLSATNVFNHPRFAAIDTAVNSPTFGQVVSVGSMRKVQLMARYHF